MDHVGIEDADNARQHRMSPTLARDLLQKAGFEIDAESELFANPDDEYSLMVYNDAVSPRTDRFLFRARKPQR